jgi:hypothetical protein
MSWKSDRGVVADILAWEALVVCVAWRGEDRPYFAVCTYWRLQLRSVARRALSEPPQSRGSSLDFVNVCRYKY